MSRGLDVTEVAERVESRPTDRAAISCTLISASCTTGWFDWIHGELWLCPDGILRHALGLGATLRHGMGRGGIRRTVGEPRPTRIFEAMDIIAILGSDQRNRWITWDEIQHATLKLGIIDHSLHVVLTNGRRGKFLWLQVDGGYEELEAALSKSLGSRFTASRSAIG